MVDNLAEKSSECPLNQGHCFHTIGTAKNYLLYGVAGCPLTARESLSTQPKDALLCEIPENLEIRIPLPTALNM